MPKTYLATAQIPVGETKDFDLSLAELDDLELERPVEAQINVAAVDRDQVIAQVRTNGSIILICDRCLEPYNQPFDREFRSMYSYEPEGEDQWPMQNSQIEISEPIRQEIIVGLPMKQICRADCAGVSHKEGEKNGSTKKT